MNIDAVPTLFENPASRLDNANQHYMYSKTHSYNMRCSPAGSLHAITQIVYEAAIISYRYQSLSYQTHLAPRDDDLIRSMAEVATGHLRIKYVIEIHEQVSASSATRLLQIVWAVHDDGGPLRHLLTASGGCGRSWS